MKFKKSNKTISYSFFLFAFMFTFIACHGTLFSYRGAFVDMENRIALLENGPHEGIWKTRDLAVNYRYKTKANMLQLSGQIEFNNHLQYNFTSLDHFSLSIYFIDEEGKILGYKTIAIAGYRKRLKNISFDHNIEMPSNVNSISFGYDGRASEGGGSDKSIHGGGDSWDFWKVPHR